MPTILSAAPGWDCRPRHAMTLFEVMLAVGIFAMILSSVASVWTTLKEVQVGTQEEAKVHELARVLAERITGANWDWIGRDRPDETKTIQMVDDSVVPQTVPPKTKSVEITDHYWRRYAWSWHRREASRRKGAPVRLPPLTDHDWTAEDYRRFRADLLGPMTSLDVDGYDPLQPIAKRLNPHNLIDLGIIDKPTGLHNLQVYVEYYRSEAIDKLFNDPGTPRYAGEPVTVNCWKGIISGKGRNGDGLDVEPLMFPESPFASDPLSDQMDPSDSAIAQKAMVVRIIVTWGKFVSWGEVRKLQRHELVLVRRK